MVSETLTSYSPAMTTRERFDTKWTTNETTGCNEWTAATDKDGYGRFFWDGATGQAHRYIWEAERGPIPEGLVVRHVGCSNPSCVNPDHLDVGTQQENMKDRDREGNAPRGARNGRSKLRPEEVRTIRRLAARGMSYRAIARRYGMHDTTIGDIAKGKLWAHL